MRLHDSLVMRQSTVETCLEERNPLEFHLTDVKLNSVDAWFCQLCSFLHIWICLKLIRLHWQLWDLVQMWEPTPVEIRSRETNSLEFHFTDVNLVIRELGKFTTFVKLYICLLHITKNTIFCQFCHIQTLGLFVSCTILLGGATARGDPWEPSPALRREESSTCCYI